MYTFITKKLSLSANIKKSVGARKMSIRAVSTALMLISLAPTDLFIF